MMKTTTKNDLIEYAYNEKGLADSDRIQRSIDGDPIVEQEFREMVQTLATLDTIQVEPSAESIEKILAFSRASNPIS